MGSFDKSLSRRFDGGAEEPRTAHQNTALHDSRCLQHLVSGAESFCRDLRLRDKIGLGKVRRWTRSGELSSGSQHFAGDTGSAVVQCDGAASSSSAGQHGRARGACNVEARRFCLRYSACWVCWRSWRGAACSGRTEGSAPLAGVVLRQARLRECDNRETLSSLSDLASSFVPHARLFSLHPSLLSENSRRVHGVCAP